MLKKIIAGCVLTGVAVTANAQCTLRYYGGNDVDKAVEKGFTIKNYESVCQKLKASNIGIAIFVSAGVLTGRSIASATALLRANESTITSYDSVGTSTYANEKASTPMAESLSTTAIMDAIDSIIMDKAISDINAKRKALANK